MLHLATNKVVHDIEDKERLDLGGEFRVSGGAICSVSASSMFGSNERGSGPNPPSHKKRDLFPSRLAVEGAINRTVCAYEICDEVKIDAQKQVLSNSGWCMLIW